MFFQYRKWIISGFILWTIISGFSALNLKFAFDFEQFFPQGDEDLEFFKAFIEEFETDDNFLLIAVENKPDVFDSVFLNDFHEYCLSLREMPYVVSVQSLTMARSPVKTPFGISTIPVIHRRSPDRYKEDRQNILNDPRYLYNLVNEDATSLVALVKHRDTLDHAESLELMNEVSELNNRYSFDAIHMLGRADLQVELVRMQKQEVMLTAGLSIILVAIILFILFRRIPGIIVSMVSISMALIIFMGLMALLGKEFNLLSALYPVLILIVGTSDVIHIKSKYIDELRKGKSRQDAMSVTIREIGIATFLTSITTSVGFMTLLTSRVEPVRDFGVNSAIGVLVAYIVVIFFTTSLLTYLPRDMVSVNTRKVSIWSIYLRWLYQFARNKSKAIVLAFFFVLGIMVWGISLISTNYKIENNLPQGARVTEDFNYFEEEYAGFRPFEIAVFIQNPYKADDYAVVREIDKIESILMEEPTIKATTSLATYYKSLEKMKRGNSREGYVFPDDSSTYFDSRRLLKRSKMTDGLVLVNKDGTKSRVSSRIADIGADSINMVSARLNRLMLESVDTSIVTFKRTGTGVIIDKNSIYIRDNLLYGLGFATIAVSLLMALLFRNIRMLLIALVPNLFPLLLAGAIIGFSHIELEAGVSVVFAIVYGIAVDDTIHFLSKYILVLRTGKSHEESLRITTYETGKAIIFTTLILFFGFMVMLFSNHQPSVTIGLLIGSTLIGALICDLTLLPILLRKYLKT